MNTSYNNYTSRFAICQVFRVFPRKCDSLREVAYFNVEPRGRSRDTFGKLVFVWYNYTMLPHIHPRKRRPVRGPVAAVPLPPSLPALLQFDGACSPNPGPMSVGYVLKDMGTTRILARVGAPIGEGTNNEAEYQALLAGMRHALKLGLWDLTIRSDSLLVVNQMHGEWKVRDHRLARLHREADSLTRLFTRFDLAHTRRENNAEADALSHEIVFEEPDLGATEIAKRSRLPKALFDWQAAAVRYWWSEYNPGAGTLGRIMGVTANLIEQIAYGKTYRTATFEGYATHLNTLLLPSSLTETPLQTA